MHRVELLLRSTPISRIPLWPIAGYLWRRIGGPATALFLLCVPPAKAEPPHPTTAYVSPPAGFISFCMRLPGQCDASAASPVELALTAERWQQIQHVNTNVNAAIWPQDDEAHYGRAEYWTIPTDGYGDCDDYALTKRKALIEAGVPIRALRIAIVLTPHNGRHAVLVVATNNGDFLLDNLTDAIIERHQSDYVWIEQQDAQYPREWISLMPGADNTRQSAVGSLSGEPSSPKNAK